MNGTDLRRTTPDRVRYIDITRGIAMICVIIGHLGISRINQIVFTFHLPIFYLISGYYLNSVVSDGEYLRRKAKALLQPYYVTCILICLLAMVFALCFHQDRPTVLKQWILASLYGAGDSWDKPFKIYSIGAIWFLWASFWGDIILRWLVRHVSSIMRICVIWLVFLISVNTWQVIWLPLSIQAGGCALFYMYAGWLLRRNREIIQKMEKRETYLFLTVVSAFVWIWFVGHFSGFWLVHAFIGNGAPDIIGSLCGCWLLVLLARVIDRVPIASGCLAYLGRYSLLILCMHVIELNVFPWGRICASAGKYTGLNEFTVLVIGKMIWILGMTCLLSRSRRIRRLFGYND